jgi:hypothetical protein
MADVKYDPAKTYRWETDTVFSLSGQEFGFIFNSLLTKRKELLRELDILNVLEAKLKDAVESGAAKEVVPEAAPVE